MKNTLYKIIYATDKEGSAKELNPLWIEQDYYLQRVTSGLSALLQGFENGFTLITSTVQNVELLDNTVVITTKNTVYYLKAYTNKEGI